MDHLPVFLQLQGAAVAVVGGGRVAARKTSLLLECGASVTVIAPHLEEELLECAAAGRVRHLSGAFAAGHLEGASLAIAATGRREVNTEVSSAARARRIPVNVVDDPGLSTFIFPAIIDRSPVVVAVGTGGGAPVLARLVREWIEALLPAALGALARFMSERRPAVRLALAGGARRRLWERIARGQVARRVLEGDEAGAQHAFERELRLSKLTGSRATGARDSGEVYLIGAGPGDPDLLTVKALRLLQQSDVVLYDRLVPDAILARARREARRIFVGKEPGRHTSQERIHELMIRLAREGLRVARLKGGDPLVFGRGGEEAQALARNGIPYLLVPGITAALGAAASAAIPLTHRGLARSVTLVTGHAAEDDTLDWSALARDHATSVFYMGVSQLPQIVTRLRAQGAPPSRPAAVIERATLPGERVLRGTLDSIAGLCAEAAVSAPALLVVGEVAALGRLSGALPLQREMLLEDTAA
jgi:uroporphyrin-III C-methyltransferase/precorrin-2 dehydrogenase/sirohydrochlorin ferrochelatase